jgi:hypothetical protein
MDKYVLKNTFVKIYIYHFLINIFIETRSSSYLVIAFMICFFNFMGKKKKRNKDSIRGCMACPYTCAPARLFLYVLLCSSNPIVP